MLELYDSIVLPETNFSTFTLLYFATACLTDLKHFVLCWYCLWKQLHVIIGRGRSLVGSSVVIGYGEKWKEGRDQMAHSANLQVGRVGVNVEEFSWQKEQGKRS